jgi:hypothetical protein
MRAGIRLPVALISGVAPRKQGTARRRNGIRRNGCWGGGEVVFQRAIWRFLLKLERLSTHQVAHIQNRQPFFVISLFTQLVSPIAPAMTPAGKKVDCECRVRRRRSSRLPCIPGAATSPRRHTRPRWFRHIVGNGRICAGC